MPFSPLFHSPLIAAGVPPPHAAGLAPVDWAIIALYASSTIFLGWWFGRRQKSVREYFVGSGKMNPVLVGVSLFASLLSTITYLSIPGETLGKGPVFLSSYLAYPLIFLVVAFVLLPAYMGRQVTSAYELLEERLGLSVRLLGAGLFLVLRLVWMTLLIYITSKAIATMIGAGDQWVPWIVLGTGLISVTYATMGGLRAVVITDLMQTVLLYGGAVLVIATVTWRMGGVSWFPSQWVESWDTQPVFSLDPSVRITIVGSVISVLIWTVCTAGGDQVSVQRFMSTRDLKAARRAVAMQLGVGAVVGLTLGLAGVALLGYFQAHPELLPPGISEKAGADRVFPHFIAYHLPPVVSGLVMAGLFAAAMSSIDSGVNSITAVVSRDFIDRFRHQPISEARHVWVARFIACGIGVIVVLGSAFVGKIPGNIMEVTQKTVNLLTAPLFSLFFFALFVKFARPAAVWASTVASILAAAAVAFSGPLALWLHLRWGVDPAVFGTSLERTIDPASGAEILRVPDPISFQWIQLVALTVAVTVGVLLSLALSAGKTGKPQPTAP